MKLLSLLIILYVKKDELRTLCSQNTSKIKLTELHADERYKVEDMKVQQFFQMTEQNNEIENLRGKNKKERKSLYNSPRGLSNALYYEDPNYTPRMLAKDFASGLLHGCAIKTDDEIYCWGDNSKGQLGYGDTIDRAEITPSYPAINIGETKAKSIHCGSKHTCVVLESDDAICWGDNQYGQLGIESTTNIGISQGDMGNNLVKVNVGSGKKIKKLAIGFVATCAILNDDTLKCWGQNHAQQLGYVHTTTLGDNVGEMGDNLPTVNFGTGRKVIDHAIGLHHACAVLDNFQVKCYGGNDKGGLGRPGDWNNPMGNALPSVDLGNVGAKQVYLLNRFSCALLNDDTVKCWGDNEFGQLGYGDYVDRGRNVGDMGNNLPVIDVGGISVLQLAVSTFHICVLLANNTVRCWGKNESCELGAGTSGNIGGGVNDMSSLSAVDFGARLVTKINAVTKKSCALFTDGTMACVGYGIGCSPDDMGENLHSVRGASCDKNSVYIDIETDANPTSTSFQVRHLNLDTLIMTGRNGYFTTPNKISSLDLCVPEGSYELTVEFNLGTWNGKYELSTTNKTFSKINATGYFYQDTQLFSFCSETYHCEDLRLCTANICNFTQRECTFPPLFTEESCRTMGNPIALVIRGDFLDAATSSTQAELSNYFFGTSGKNFTLASQFSHCSYEKFNIMPFSGSTTTSTNVTDGVLSVVIDETSAGETSGYIAEKMITKATEIVGDLLIQFDFVIVCLPPGTFVGTSTNWKAYAFVNSYLSIYNDMNCIYPSVQMHELGHNLGLSHSNDEANYGDTTGMQGISSSLIDGPLKCFNAPKSFELQWYTDSDLVMNLEEIMNKEVELVGISDYDRRGTRSTHVKIINTEDGFDYYISFNRASGMNLGTGEGLNEVLITKRVRGNFYADSELIAKLGHLQKYSIFGIGPNRELDLQIIPNIILNDDPGFARISFSTWEVECDTDENCNDYNLCTMDKCAVISGVKICQNIPLECDSCGAQVILELYTNDFSEEIYWNIQNMLTKKITKSSVYYTDDFTHYNFNDCFEYGKYQFSIYYANTTFEYTNNATFSLTIGNEIFDDGKVTGDMYSETIFTICSTDSACIDYDGCTVDYCDVEKRICNNSFVRENENCIRCTWLSLNLTTDNFPEETKWNLFDYDKDLLVESGDPYPKFIYANGRRKAPTKSGRRKAPTKSGRRKAPTRSSSARALINDDIDIFEKVCLENHIKYYFIITDTFGDGICCGEGEGSYTIIISDKVIKMGGNFSMYDEMSFKFSPMEEGCEDDDPSMKYVYDPEISTCLYYPVNCDEYGAFVTVLIRSDVYSDDTFWQVKNFNKSVEMEGFMYELAFTQYKSKECLTYGQYSFEIQDFPGDGMAYCFENECGFDVLVNNVTILENDGSFGKFSIQIFGICNETSDCNDEDDCTLDYCDEENRVCVYEQMDCSGCGKETVTVDIKTDMLFSLTSWNLMDSMQNISIATGGPFVKSYSGYQQVLCVSTGTYLFNVRNSEGRGMVLCKDNFDCGYSVNVNGEEIIKSDGSVEYEVNHSFVICDFDSDCENENSCSIGRCNNSTKLCRFENLLCSTCNKKGFKVIVDTDGNATETSWKLLSLKNQSIVSSGGKFAKSYTKYSYHECIPKGEYIYTIFDKGGNGLSACFSNQTNCGYKVAIDDEVIIEDVGDFTSELSYSLKLCDDDTSCNKVLSTFIPISSPTAITSPVDTEYFKIKSFATGFYHTCALTSKNAIYCWGDNSFGQLGYGDTINRALSGEELFAINIGEANEAREVHAGAFHTCIVTVEEDIICWGDNSFGQLGIGSTFNIGVSEGEMGNALKKVNLGSGRKVKRVSLGYQHSCVILDNDNLKCWGNNHFGQLGYARAPFIGGKPDDMGENLTFVELGSNSFVEDLSAGTFHTCVIQSHQVKCWGKNSNGQLGYGDKLDRGMKYHSMGNHLPTVNINASAAQISAGNSVTCIVTHDGKAKCFGYNKFSQLGYGDKLQRGETQHTMGDNLPYVDIGDDNNITYITRGAYSVCTLSSTKTVKCWGWNLECSLGTERKDDYFTMGNNLPNVDFGRKRVKDIQMHHWHGCALLEDETLSCWGYNRFGQLGLGHKQSIGCHPDEMGLNLETACLYDATPWTLKVNSVSAPASGQSIDIEYYLSKSITQERFSSTIYDKTCSYISNNTSIFVAGSDFKTKPAETLDQNIVTVGVDYTKIRSSQFWSDNSVNKGVCEFCVVSELYFDNTKSSVITLTETIITSYINFEGNFNITGIRVSKSDASELREGSHFQLEACLCNNDHICERDPVIHQDSDILLCVHSYGDLVISKFQIVNFYQDGILKFKSVENGEAKLLTSTAIKGDYGVIGTRLTADFFRTPNPAAVHVTGEVYLDFRTRSRGRSLSQNRQGSFKINISLQSKSNGSFSRFMSLSFIFAVTFAGFLITRKRAQRNYRSYTLIRTDEVYDES